MPVFETQRHENVDYRAERLRNTAKARKANLKYMRESMESSNGIEVEQSVLESIDNETVIENALLNEADRMAERRNMSLAKQELATLENRLYNENKDTLLESVVFDIVKDSCWIDEPVKENMILEMYECFMETLDTLDELKIEKPLNESLFLSNLKEISVMETKKACKRISEDCDESNCQDPDEIKSIDFSLNDDEYNEFEDNVSDLGKEDIVELVKNKVLTVVKDEKRSGESKKEMIEKINTDLEEMDTDKDGIDDDIEIDAKGSTDDVSESVKFQDLIKRNRLRKVNSKYGSSLFESIMLGSYNNISSVLEGKDDSKQNKKKKDKKTKTKRAEKVSKLKQKFGKDKKDKNKDIEATKEQMLNSAMLEAIVTYTCLETFNTLDMYKFDYITVEKLKNHYKVV